MTAHSLTLGSDAPGKGGSRSVRQIAARPPKQAYYLLDFGTDNYTVNGVDISDIWDDFTQVNHICVEQHDTSTAGDRREFAVDYTAKTLIVYDAFNTEESASDQGVITVSMMVFGY